MSENFNKSFWEQEESGNLADSEVGKAVLSIIENSNQQDSFDVTISTETYMHRGFIKDGELVRSSESLLGLSGQSKDFIQHENGWNVSVYPENVLIAGIDAGEELSKEEIEKGLLGFLTDNTSKLDSSWAIIYAFNMFRDEDAKCPPHRNNCVEFKGCFEFIKAEKGWVLVKYSRAIYFPPKL